jgi:putative DNA methylase
VRRLREVLAEQEGEFDSNTRWAISWFEQYGVREGPFGVAETLSKAKNSAINGLEEAGIVKAQGGKVKLISRNELLDEWSPLKDEKMTVWGATQQLIRVLEIHGEPGAAELLRHIDSGMRDNARDLAYRLYMMCERKKWSQEAFSYNSLILSWPEITSLMQKATKMEKSQRTLIEES